ncbi:MAG: energy coupling factor transporter S component ThiW, partial [Firmicutes bacterium]|nr:energy coupling factor transporter S component ThiW [Bacillota bacterium]
LIGEVFGTTILGGLCAYPVAVLLMGQSSAGLAFYAYIVPFLISTAAGSLISGILLRSLEGTGVLHRVRETVGR